ncbi:tRNA-dihydrouridine(47) synthase [NAD(P)(+)]-like [Halotydeus destructor]|nr:tRNA-dihydrouridine(47) synthase [NAD(P)(+)]-like [Halotydeus destructor]
MSQMGIAPIKSEFLVQACQKQMDLSHISKADQEKMASEKRQLDGDSHGNSRSKKTKFKGQNKHRKNEMFKERMKNKPKIRLCHNFVAGGDDEKIGCTNADTCNFSHDIASYLKEYPKRENIGDICHAFDQYGYCTQGALCRFSSSHTNVDFTNVINAEKWGLQDPNQVKNVLTKELQTQLRKKTFNFASSLETVSQVTSEKEVGPIVEIEKKKIDFAGKYFLAPLTTVGNLPFRRIAKNYGADITCGEMAMAQNLVEGQQSEWALLRRHACEDFFGVQLCGAHPDTLAKTCQLIKENCEVDFVDLNMGCPIDLVFKRGAGSGLMGRLTKLNYVVDSMYQSLGEIPLTLKMRTGIFERKTTAAKVIEAIKEKGAHRVALYTVHGRSREARYTKSADWNYIEECAQVAAPTPLFGSGDVMSYADLDDRIKSESKVSGAMLARGALIKPWVFTELKERRHWDISSSERFDMLKKFTNYGLEQWGSDDNGVEKTRRFLLEWLSFLHRYIPVGLLEVVPQRINDRPMAYRGRDDLETLMASGSCNDWIKISEMLLGNVPDSFMFLPKHKANAYSYRDEGVRAPDLVDVANG